MPDLPAPPPEARRILQLARTDRLAAGKALGELSAEAQRALVCDTPLARRAAVMNLLPAPEQVIPLIPEAELCFTLKAIGLESAAWILEHATPHQVVACLDLDAWNGITPDHARLDQWLDAIADTEETALLRSIHSIDAELFVLYLKGRIDVAQKPAESDGWDPPDGMQTLDDQFYYGAQRDNDDVAAITTILKALHQHDYWTYFRMLHGVIWELDSENEEWAGRWRSGRLQDLGFPPWDEAANIYRYVAPSRRAALPEHADALELGERQLPVWIPGLPAGRDGGHLLFRVVAELSDDERGAAFYALIAIANKVAVADRMNLGDAEVTPMAIEKAARWISRGIEHVASENGVDPAAVLRRASLEWLFRVGANLDPEAART